MSMKSKLATTALLALVATGVLATTNAKNLPSQLKLLYAMSTKGPKVRRAAAARLQQQARKASAA